MEDRENQFIEKLIPFLHKYFEVKREVKSKCGKGRIDLLLKARGHNDIYFGGECKICPPLSYKYFILNQEQQEIENKIWHLDRHSEYHEHHTMNGFIGAFNVGELRKGFDKEKYYFLSFSNKPVWSSKIANIYNSNNEWVGKQMKGIHEKFYIELMKKICK